MINSVSKLSQNSGLVAFSEKKIAFSTFLQVLIRLFIRIFFTQTKFIAIQHKSLQFIRIKVICNKNKHYFLQSKRVEYSRRSQF